MSGLSPTLKWFYTRYYWSHSLSIKHANVTKKYLRAKNFRQVMVREAPKSKYEQKWICNLWRRNEVQTVRERATTRWCNMLQKGCDQVKKGIWPMLWACNHQLALGDQGSNVSEKLVICFGDKMRVVVASLLCLATGDPWIIEQWCSFFFNLAKVVETSFHENKLFLLHLQFFSRQNPFKGLISFTSSASQEPISTEPAFQPLGPEPMLCQLSLICAVQ